MRRAEVPSYQPAAAEAKKICRQEAKACHLYIGRSLRVTPAMQAGIADHISSWEELLTAGQKIQGALSCPLGN